MSNPKKQPHFYLQPISAACLMLIALAATNLSAAPLALSQQPAGNSGREPAPNVIISVDNSGSMAQDTNGSTSSISAANPSKMTSLKAALTSQFITLDAAGNPKVPNNRIRLAWQSMWVNSGGVAGSDSLTLGATNSMKRLSDGHRANFSTFVTALTAANGTPSHKMMKNAYDYMKSPAGTNSPWADNPGTAQTTDYLACRRTYHVFMTDGAWNTQGSDNTYAARKPDGTNGGDGASRVLPSPHASLNLLPPPPTQYDPTSPQVKVYKDQWGNDVTKPSTLSDLAFRSWAEDLQTTMDNKIKPLIKQSGTETVGATTLQEFWNPKNDPATWQHITQHTIGFGSGATNWGTGIAPLWSATNDNYGGDYPNLVNGTVVWPSPVVTDTSNTPDIRTSELWHSALNGRGKFYPALNANALTAAFSDILDNILADTSKPLVSIAANGTRLKSGLYAYQAGYDGTNWAGRLLAYPIDSTTGAIGTTAEWNAATLLDATGFSVANRFVMTSDTPPGSPYAAGLPWTTYTSMPAAQQLPLSKNSSGTVDHTTTNNYGQLRVNYIRGDRTKEASQTGGIFRNRDSRLGDIVNSNVLYVGKPNSGYSDTAYATFKDTSGVGGSRAAMVYVGANDGMLHGFDAGTGVEKLAYIPQGIAQGDLRKLTDTTYTHQYFVDGTPFTSDAKVGNATASAWKTVLVSGLGGGGKGYFALDASNPSNFTTTNIGNLVIADTTFSNAVTTLSTSAAVTPNSASTYDPDMGNMYITPAMDDYIAGKSDQIVRLNAPTSGTAPNQIKHRWALVLGNGYNSTNEAPVLLVQYLDGAREIKKISPCISSTTNLFNSACAYKTGNGLSTPRLVDLDGDGVADVAYAGDLQGNVWKFNLSSTDNADWITSFNQAPLFKAKPGQSFTTAPYVVSNDAAGYGHMVHISSGKNLTNADQISTITETTYGLWDNSTFGQVAVLPLANPPTYRFQVTDSTAINTTSSNTLPNSMVPQSLSATTYINNGSTYYTQTNNAVSYKGTTTKRGWFMDWTVPGQRVLRNSKSFDGQQISIYSTVPNSAVGSSNVETCTPSTTGERNFLTTINLFTGSPAKTPVYNVPSTNAPTTTTVEVPPGDPLEFTTADGKGSKYVTPCPEGQVCTGPGSGPIGRKFGSYVGARANWREKQ